MFSLKVRHAVSKATIPALSLITVGTIVVQNNDKHTSIAPLSNTTSCEMHTAGPSKSSQPSSYPNFKRHGQDAPLVKHLTPEIYDQLKDRKTDFKVTLENIIQAGVALPWGSNPPRGLGLYAGDADSYIVFAPLLVPIMEDYHGTQTVTPQEKDNHPNIRRVNLKRQVTNLNPKSVFSQPIDPAGDYILYTRMRVSRSLKEFPFSPSISREKRRQVERILKECVEEDFRKGQYHSLMDMTNAEHNDLKGRHILFKDPDAYANLAGFGRDWPDARGLYCDNFDSPEVIIWCNDNDHFRIISMQKGGSLLHVFTKLTETLTDLEAALTKRGHVFATDPKLGFLNTSPTNCGTGLRASVCVKLVRLGRQQGFQALLQRMKLEASTRFNEHDNPYTGIFDVANAERLGQSEVQLINTMISGVGCLIQLEKQLERGEEIDLNEIER